MAKGPPVAIQAVGMKELRQSLKTLGDGAKAAGKELRGAYKEAADLVADRGRASASGSRMGHVAVASIKSRATQTSASVIAGRGVPWFAGHNFGSHQGPRKRQFPVVAKPDYHLWRTVEQDGAEIVDIFANAVDELIERSGFR